MSHRKLHVIIVGASASGLTLAHCLSSAGVDFTVLEARTSQISHGAGLVIQPNGARILDQLGLYDEVQRQAERIASHSTCFDNGRLLLNVDTRFLTSRRNRTGYPLFIISRQALLSILFDHLPRRDCVRFGKKVIRVAPSPGDVTVHTADGSALAGDLVVGADGVHCAPRCGNIFGREIPLETSFAGVFGIAESVKGLKQGVAYRTFGTGWSMKVMVGMNAQVFWYVSMICPQLRGQAWRRQQGKTSVGPMLAPFLNKHVSRDIFFGEIYNRTSSFTYVPIEESFQNQWSAGRFACIGDAVHKMTPNIGQGANCAMETAASLGNYILLANDTYATCTEASLESMLGDWENDRKGRMRLFYWVSKSAVRIEAGRSWWLRILRSYLSYFHATMSIVLLGDITPQTARVQHLPLPLR
ncbi:FAD-dependent oxidoreductase, partial [Aspergillus saccharolyticus JOP 1030-1]